MINNREIIICIIFYGIIIKGERMNKNEMNNINILLCIILTCLIIIFINITNYKSIIKKQLIMLIIIFIMSVKSLNYKLSDLAETKCNIGLSILIYIYIIYYI